MDFSTFKTSDWLKVGGGVAALIGYFLDWTDADGPFNLSGSSFFWRGTLPWLLILAVAVLTVLFATGKVQRGSTPWSLLFLGGTGLALLLLFILFVHPTYAGTSFSDIRVGRGFGMWLTFLAGIAAFAGSLLGFKESGGKLDDLTDIDKIKSQFNKPGNGRTPPPPPPPGS